MRREQRISMDKLKPLSAIMDRPTVRFVSNISRCAIYHAAAD
jgi:hypothetical protein